MHDHILDSYISSVVSKFKHVDSRIHVMNREFHDERWMLYREVAHRVQNIDSSKSLESIMGCAWVFCEYTICFFKNLKCFFFSRKIKLNVLFIYLSIYIQYVCQ